MTTAEPRRQEVRVGADDGPARRELHRRGFRLEGRLRAARVSADGTGWVDELVYARLAGDPAGPDAHTHVLNTITPRKRLIAHALVTDERGRVLLCETSFKADWEFPGGLVEPGESPREACEREMVEEMAFAPAVQGVLVVDWLRPHRGWEDAVELVFATAPVTDAEASRLRPDGHEILGLHWLTPADAEARLAPFAIGRLRAALAAHRDGRTRYLEGGESLEAHPNGRL